MVKRLPGWVNFLGLWAVYFLIGWGVDLVCGWHTDKRFIGFLTAMYAGAYLAKWRFDGKTATWSFW